ncbi:MAG: hypothetical protein KBD06_00865 [Candidatus Pacebacteria bacterium]|nr:hypothetical protein [Candidatus Paceibacterota bacterium]
MRDRQLQYWLAGCVAVLAVLAMFGKWLSVVYVLLPTLPLLAALYPMTWVEGSASVWWYRFAIPWTVAAMAAILVTPAAGKPFVSTIAVLILSVITLVILTNKVVLKYYRIARSETA